jgi:hypothetical protein
MEVELPVAHLSNHALLEETKRLAKESRIATARLILSLVELEKRKAYVDAGYSSLTAFCREALWLSEHETELRVQAVHVGQIYPGVLDGLADGSLSPTNVALLAQYLTPENHEKLLADARYKTKREVQAQIAGLVTDGVALFPLRLDVPVETLNKLDRACDLLLPVLHGRNQAEVIDYALTTLLEVLEKKKLALTDSQRAVEAFEKMSRYIPAYIRRFVWKRDGGRCRFVGTHGRCTETSGLEFHHLKPYAAGGRVSADNIELRCRAHNVREAELYFGRSMESMRKGGRKRRESVRSDAIIGSTQARNASVTAT